MKTVNFYNIQWDTDNRKTNLPTKLTMEVDDDTDTATEGADILSDDFGFCVESFEFEEL